MAESLPNSSSPKKSGRAFKILGAVLGIFLLGVALLPTFVSLAGPSLVENIVNPKLKGSISLSKVNVGWFSAQHLENVRLKDETGREILNAASVDVQDGLFKLLLNSFTPAQAKVQNLNAVVEGESDGTINLLNALGIHQPLTQVPLSPLSAQLADVNAEWQLLNATSGTIHVEGNTVQSNSKGAFNIDLSLNDLPIAKLSQFSQSDWMQAVQAGKIRLHADGKSFPLIVADFLLGLKDPQLSRTATTLLGSSLDFEIRQTHQDDQLHVDLTASSQNFELFAPLRVVSNHVELASPAKIDLNLKPEALKAMTFKPVFIRQGTLLAPVQLRGTIESLSVPIAALIDKRLEAVGTFRLESTPIRFKHPLQQLEVKDIVAKGQINGQDLNGELNAHYIQNNFSTPISIGFSKTGNQEFKFQVRSNALKVPSLTLNLGPDALQMQAPEVIFDIPASLLAPWLSEANQAYLTNVKGHLELQELNIPKSGPDFLWNRSTVNAFLKVPQLQFNTLAKKAFNIEGLTARLNGNLDKQALTELNFQLHPNDQNSNLKSWLSSNGKVHVQGDLSLAKQINWIGSIQSELAKAHLNIALNEQLDSLTLLAPVRATLQLPRDSFKSLGIDLADDHTIVQLNIDRFKQPVNFKNLQDLDLSGEVRFNALTLIKQGTTAALKNFIMPWKIDQQTKDLSITFSGQTEYPHLKQSGHINGTLKAHNWLKDQQLNFANAVIDANIDLKKLPMAFVDLLAQQPHLSALLGQNVDLKLIAHLQPDTTKTGSINLTMQGDGLLAELNFAVDQMIQLKEPGKVQFSIDNTRFQALRNFFSKGEHDSLALTSPSDLHINFKSLSLPRQLNEWKRIQFDANLNANRLNIGDRRSSESLLLENIIGSLSSQAIENGVNLSLNAKERSKGQSPSDVKLNGQLGHLFNSQGEFNSKALSAALELQFKNLPIDLIGQLLALDKNKRAQAEALFGKTLETDINVKLDQMNGPIRVTAKGSNGQFALDGNLQKGLLTLKQDFKAQVGLTDLVARLVLEELFPVFEGIRGNNQQLILTIPAKNFTLPVQPFDLNRVTIESAVLDLGQVSFSGQGKLASALSLLKISSPQLSVWLTPVYFDVSQGTLTLKRVDMLVDQRFPLAAWGKVDFVKDKVRMMIGLTSIALQQAFGINGLKADDMLQLPLRGTLKDVSIDKTKAAAKISAMVAQNSGPQGAIIGTVINIAAGGLSEEKIPEPTTKPLPWADQVKFNESKQPTEKKAEPVKKDETTKAVEPEKHSKKRDKKEKDKSRGKKVESLLNEFLR